MPVVLFICSALVRFRDYSTRKDVQGVVGIEVLERSELYGLIVSAIASKYPDAGDIDFLKVNEGPDSSIEAIDWNRFEVGELVLVANPVNNMIDPLPAYRAWELREIESIAPGGPVVWVDKEENIIFYAMVPFGVRRVWFELQEVE